MYSKSVAALLIGTALLAGCAEGNQKQGIGAILGGVGGAVAGSQFGAGKGRLLGVALGTLAGAYIGSEIGKSMDDVDRMKSRQTTQQSLEYGRAGTTSAWSNPDNGHSGTITPTRTYQANNGQNCREYKTTVNIDGQTEEAHGTACREADGTWRVIN